MQTKEVKSVITCDLEGRIMTANKAVEPIFGYLPEELVGNKRISLFSPGMVVLGHVQNWLQTAKEQGEFLTQTVFLKRDGTPFTADIRISPTFKGGQQIGYCGVTLPRPDIPPDVAMPKTTLGTKIFAWLVITRAPFLTATIVPVLTAAAWVYSQGYVQPFPWYLFLLAFIGAIALHIAANTFNDYFDWKSGTDPVNNEYFSPFSGGSRSIELRLITEKKLLLVAWASLGVAILAGLPILYIRGPVLLLFGLVGAFSVYFYTAPPLRLAARKGLGEFVVGFNFGPMLVAGIVFTLTGLVTWEAFIVGLPIGLLTAAILWINQFPDMKADALTGKNNLVVLLGLERARWGYVMLLAAAFGLPVIAVVFGVLPVTSLLMLAGLPLAISTVSVLFRHYNDRALVNANASTIRLHMVAGLLLAAGFFISPVFNTLLG
ncbi:MAG: UbiA family prenyltransferase [Anaerolineales bacterium]